jgi:hypothetical protein
MRIGAGAAAGGASDAMATMLEVRIKRRSDGSVIWEGRAISDSGGDRSAAVERLSEALFQDFPGGIRPHYQDAMNLSISSAFDGGNIRLVAIDGNRIDLEIVKDHQSDFYQWFYFRLTGAEGKAIELRIINCEGAAYPLGWPGYRACMSYDREYWERVAETRYEAGSSPFR